MDRASIFRLIKIISFKAIVSIALFLGLSRAQPVDAVTQASPEHLRIDSVNQTSNSITLFGYDKYNDEGTILYCYSTKEGEWDKTEDCWETKQGVDRKEYWSWEITGLDSDTKYYIYIYGFNSRLHIKKPDETPFASLFAEITTDQGSVSIHGLRHPQGESVNILQIGSSLYINKSNLQQASVHDLAGNLLSPHHKINSGKKIVFSLKPGVYFLRVTQGRQTVLSRKICYIE